MTDETYQPFDLVFVVSKHSISHLFLPIFTSIILLMFISWIIKIDPFFLIFFISKIWIVLLPDWILDSHNYFFLVLINLFFTFFLLFIFFLSIIVLILSAETRLFVLWNFFRILLVFLFCNCIFIFRSLIFLLLYISSFFFIFR